MPNSEIRAFFCSHKDVLDDPLPCPAGLRIRFTSAKVSDEKLETETDSKGQIRSLEIKAGTTYRVELAGAESKWWEPSQDTLARRGGAGTGPLEVKLVPRESRWRVALSLSRDGVKEDPVAGATVRITDGDHIFDEKFRFDEEFQSYQDGHVYGVASEGTVTLRPAPCIAGDQKLVPEDPAVTLPVKAGAGGQVHDLTYRSAIQISIKPIVKSAAGDSGPLTGASVTVERRGSLLAAASSTTQVLARQDDTVRFEFAFPGIYLVTVTPPAAAAGWPIKDGPQSIPAQYLDPGTHFEHQVDFKTVDSQEITVQVSTPQGKRLTSDAHLLISGPGDETVRVAATTDARSVRVPSGVPLTIQLDSDHAPPTIGNIPLQMPSPGQEVAGSPATNVVQLTYQHSITGQAVDEHGQAVPGAMIDIFGGGKEPVVSVVADKLGGFELGLAKAGTYYLAQHPMGGSVGIREPVEVHSNGRATVRVYRGPGDGAAGRGALGDLSAYPLLTEEITTTGAPAPATGGPGAGGPGAGYGQTVDQVMRDVLGWRPGGDFAGFQAALTGAFQLKEVEGHTEWSWQQRGYAVQADMGALTGAQASIYARAKSALDQILPLLAGLKTLNPALYAPQDLESIRSVVTVELNELVNELALEGGPRIQRVDELFGLLLGDSIGSTNLNPDLIQGQLGILRERFGLTVDQIDTVDEERTVTNFRIVVEQILALQASWSTDRNLLSGVDSRTSLGTILIWLSRSLEAVCESVDDLTFALDSVYVDAAQRQVIDLRLGPNEPPLLLSDLLDWVVRASRDEGPRIVQDAGKDGVFAFAPVLERLRGLINATLEIAEHGNKLPTGMKTPRVKRALQVLASQLAEAARLARLVRRDEVPQVMVAWLTTSEDEQTTVFMLGSGFRKHASAVLIPEGREDLASLPALPGTTKVDTPNVAHASFIDPRTIAGGAGTTWLVSLINADETQSKPIEVLHVPRHDY